MQEMMAKERPHTKRCHPVKAIGKQVMVNNLHWCDCADDYKAIVTAKALEKYFCHCS